MMFKLGTIVLQKTTVTIKAPFFDGIFGGEHCEEVYPTGYEEENRTISSKGGENGEDYHYASYSFTENKCQIQICGYTHSDEYSKGKTLTIEPAKCIHNHWTEWGEWGKCDIKCGDDGLRFRNRKCINACTGEEKGKDDCTPAVDFISKKSWTNKMSTMCTPCPDNDKPRWTEWSDWSFSPTETTCWKTEEEKKSMTRTRASVCTAKHGLKCPPSPSGQNNGTMVEEQTFPKNQCGQS